MWNESSLTNGLWAGGGGASAGNIASGVGTTPGVPKPNWQYGVTGIPSDGVRDLPDVSLTAAQHDPYLLCLEGSCVPNAQGEIYVYFVSGTSASAPSFAGIMALMTQADSLSRLGVANYVVYRLAATQGSYPSQCNGSNTSTPPASNCVFNDVTVGNNVVPGEVGNDYQASVGYDMTTGLGSVNVGNLYATWNTVTFNPSTTALSLNGGTAVNITHGQSVPFTVTVSPSSGTGSSPTGNAVLLTSNGLFPSTMELFNLTGGQVTNTISQLPGSGNAPYNVWARYGGDSTYAPSDSNTVSVTVNPEASTITETILAFDQNGHSIPLTNIPFGDFVYTRADVKGNSGYGVPTGTVTFTDTFGPIPGGSGNTITFPLNGQGNTADPQGITFDAGLHTVSAAYSGDPSFNPSSTTQSQTFTIAPGFFASIASAQSVVVISAPGGSGQSSVTVSNSTNFSGTINLACVGLPSEATCTFTPSSVAASGTAGSTSVSIAVTTTAPTAMRRSQRQGYVFAQWLFGLGLIGSFVLIGGKQRRVRGMLVLLLLALVIPVPGCGGGGGGSSGPPPNQGTPPGTYNITVNATSGSAVVGIELRRVCCRRRVTTPTLSVARWVCNSAMATFSEAPL